jgi:hypothetical protein
MVAQRENTIVNRLNKTKIEKFPDLQMEKEEKLKAIRKKDQAAKLERVSVYLEIIIRLYVDRMAEKGRGKNRRGEEGEEMAKRPCL